MSNAAHDGGVFLCGVIWTLVAVLAWVIASGFKNAIGARQRKPIDPPGDA